ncbi:MAG: polysaccharide deacetylase family protein [Eubacteriales bacterium]|nr:polysaccharide deacetylase family protein [Eubacteriales bacterium]MDY3332935.1 polysaccharide deacetylase family protein [Gallibacter sp.]
MRNNIFKNPKLLKLNPVTNVSSNIYNKKKARINRGFGRKIVLSIIILLIVAIGYFLLSSLKNANYTDKSSFEKYSEKYFSNVKEYNDIDTKDSVIKFSQPVSISYELPDIGKKHLETEIEKYLSDISDNCIGKYNDKDLNEKYVLMSGFSSYINKDKLASILFITTEKHEKNTGKFETLSTKVKSINYETESGYKIMPALIFNHDYKEKISKYINKYIKDNKIENLTKDYKYYIDTKAKFDTFILKNNSIIFYFDSNTITKGNDLFEIEISKDDVKGLFKDKFNPQKIDPSKPMVAITYQEGPKGEYTSQILDAYEKNNAVATFFELGQSIEKHYSSKKILKRMLKLNCEIGNLSYTYTNLKKLSNSEIKEEYDKTDKLINNLTGFTPTLMRAPYGQADDDIAKLVKKTSVNWSIDSLDWNNYNKDQMIELINKSGSLDGKIILFQESHEETVKATRELIPMLKKKGYQFVTVSDLLTYKYGVDPSLPKHYGKSYFSDNK